MLLMCWSCWAPQIIAASRQSACSIGGRSLHLTRCALFEVCAHCSGAPTLLPGEGPPSRRNPRDLRHDGDGERESSRAGVPRLDHEKHGEQHAKERPPGVEAEESENTVPGPRGGEAAAERAEQQGELFGPPKRQRRDGKEHGETSERRQHGARESREVANRDSHGPLCPGQDSNLHGSRLPRDFKSLASTGFATRALTSATQIWRRKLLRRN